MAGTVDAPGNVIIDDVTARGPARMERRRRPVRGRGRHGDDHPDPIVPLDATDDVPVPTDLADRLATDHAAAGADLTYELLVRAPAG